MTITSTTNPAANNVATVQRFVDDVLNHGRFDLLADLLHDDYRYIGPDGAELHGHDALVGLLSMFRAGFSDLEAHVGTAIGSGDTVAMTMTLTGTHDGDFDGIPATGARLELPLAIFTTMVDGRIAVDREFYDSGVLLAQLAPTPQPLRNP